MVAAARGMEQCIYPLLHAGADFTIRNGNAGTAYEVAIDMAHFSLAKIFDDYASSGG